MMPKAKTKVHQACCTTRFLSATLLSSMDRNPVGFDNEFHIKRAQFL